MPVQSQVQATRPPGGTGRLTQSPTEPLTSPGGTEDFSIPLTPACACDVFRNLVGLLNACGQRWAGQIISGEEDPWGGGAEFVEGGEDSAVAEIVLWDPASCPGSFSRTLVRGCMVTHPRRIPTASAVGYVLPSLTGLNTKSR